MAQALRMAAESLSRSDSYLGARYRRLRGRMDGKAPVKAMARYLACPTGSKKLVRYTPRGFELPVRARPVSGSDRHQNTDSGRYSAQRSRLDRETIEDRRSLVKRKSGVGQMECFYKDGSDCSRDDSKRFIKSMCSEVLKGALEKYMFS